MPSRQDAAIPDAPPFADAQLSFTASIFDSLSGFPHNHAPIQGLALPAAAPANSRAIFEALAAQLQYRQRQYDQPQRRPGSVPAEHKPSAAQPREQTVKKYLPESYRQAFISRSPRHANLVTDDSYHCAIKGAKLVPGFQRSGEFVSWGKVFAHLMRQPFLAEQAGLIYRTSLTVQATHFPNGGWLYVDLAPGSDYRQQLDADHTFIRRYAARIPRLVAAEPRHVFASVLFPVLFKVAAGDADPPPPGSNYDQLFIAAAEYDDGFAKIVHCRQPTNRDLLEEKSDGSYPVKDVGVNLGWDDEEITDRYIRQLENDPAGGMDGRVGCAAWRVRVRDRRARDRTNLRIPGSP